MLIADRCLWHQLSVFPISAMSSLSHCAARLAVVVPHPQEHWFTIRKVEGAWWNFNSIGPAPEALSDFYLAAFLDSLKEQGYTIFVVRTGVFVVRSGWRKHACVRGRGRRGLHASAAEREKQQGYSGLVARKGREGRGEAERVQPSSSVDADKASRGLAGSRPIQ